MMCPECNIQFFGNRTPVIKDDKRTYIRTCPNGHITPEVRFRAKGLKTPTFIAEREHLLRELRQALAKIARLRPVVETVANHSVRNPDNEFIGGRYAADVVRDARAALAPVVKP